MKKKINKKGFYCPCDTKYFNDFGKVFALSVKKFAPWAHIHFHIFDSTQQDQLYCQKNNFSFTSEQTPQKYSNNIESKKDFWVNMRFIRIPEIYENDTIFMSIDADSIFVKPLSEKQFSNDLKHSWVTTAPKREQLSLGSALGFAGDDSRKILANKLSKYLDTPDFKWCLDQKVLDDMLEKKEIEGMDLRYSDYRMNDDSFIWTGKGNRKFKQKFSSIISEYRKKI